MSSASGYAERFRTYFDREPAQKAAHSLSNGVEIEFRIEGDAPETFTFTKAGGQNAVKDGPASSPQLLFTLTSGAADAILADSAEDIGTIGVNIMKLVVSNDPARRVRVQFKAGFLSLFSKGYLGILTAGGSQFAAYLASRGLNGMGAIKAALKKLKAD